MLSGAPRCGRASADAARYRASAGAGGRARARRLAARPPAHRLSVEPVRIRLAACAGGRAGGGNRRHLRGRAGDAGGLPSAVRCRPARLDGSGTGGRSDGRLRRSSPRPRSRSRSRKRAAAASRPTQHPAIREVAPRGGRRPFAAPGTSRRGGPRARRRDLAGNGGRPTVAIRIAVCRGTRAQRAEPPGLDLGRAMAGGRKLLQQHPCDRPRGPAAGASRQGAPRAFRRICAAARPVGRNQADGRAERLCGRPRSVDAHPARPSAVRRAHLFRGDLSG